MQHKVVNFQSQLQEIYNDCDPVVLEKLMSTSLPLFKRHWLESVEIIDTAAKSQKILTLTERQIIEVINFNFSVKIFSSVV